MPEQPGVGQVQFSLIGLFGQTPPVFLALIPLVFDRRKHPVVFEANAVFLVNKQRFPPSSLPILDTKTKNLYFLKKALKFSITFLLSSTHLNDALYNQSPENSL